MVQWNGQGPFRTARDALGRLVTVRPRTLWSAYERFTTGVLKRPHFKDGEVTEWPRDGHGMVMGREQNGYGTGTGWSRSRIKNRLYLVFIFKNYKIFIFCYVPE